MIEKWKIRITWAMVCSTNRPAKDTVPTHYTQMVEMGETDALVRTRSEAYYCDVCMIG